MSGLSLYPSRCIFCGKLMDEDKLICAECVGSDVLIKGKICALCGLEKSRCTCDSKKHHYARKIACVYYQGAVQRGIARLKFYRHTMLASHYGKMMAENVRSKYAAVNFDAIIPVPMNLVKQWLRGYNCTELLAKEIEKGIQVPVLDDVLFRRFGAKMQKRVPLSRRAANVLDMFYIKRREKIAGKTILLVDDVCTTGATLNECAKMLKLYGAQKVYAVTFAAVAKNK